MHQAFAKTGRAGDDRNIVTAIDHSGRHCSLLVRYKRSGLTGNKRKRLAHCVAGATLEGSAMHKTLGGTAAALLVTAFAVPASAATQLRSFIHCAVS